MISLSAEAIDGSFHNVLKVAVRPGIDGGPEIISIQSV